MKQTMTSRQRLQAAIEHREPDRPPLDLGATTATGMAISTMMNYRRYLGLDEHLLKATEPYQMLGQVEEDLRQAVGADIVAIGTKGTRFGYRNENFKPWTMPDGLEVLVGGGFAVTKDKDGGFFIYPQGDLTVRPCGKMPSNGYFFDLISHQEEIDEDEMDGPADFANDFPLIPDSDLKDLEQQADDLYKNTEYGLLCSLPGASLGCAGLVPGAFLKETPGIRKVDEWLMAHYLYPEYVHDVYAFQTERAIENLERMYQAMGDRPQVVVISTTDFGTQNAEMISPDMFREFYKPYYKKMNDWVHEHTGWKTFYHSCGSIPNLIPDMIECGVDILNPVQCSARGMDAVFLKEKFGADVTFWGGGVDTQHVLPFGTPEEVGTQAAERLSIFEKGGGYVFTSIHNIVARVPAENVDAFYRAYREKYGI